MAHHGTVHWNELNTHNSKAARAFYGETMGWTFEPMPMQDGSNYWIIKSGETMVGGIFEMIHEAFKDVPEHWFTHFAVDDLDARLAKTTANGGTITRPPWHIPGVGKMAVLQAASGSFCLFIQPDVTDAG